MFKELLKGVVERTEGGVAGVVMGFDGIPVDYYATNAGGFDVEAVGAEFSGVLREIRKAAQMLEAGDAREVSIQAEKLTTVVRLLNDEYFVAVTLRPDGNVGKARYLLRREAENVLAALS